MTDSLTAVGTGQVDVVRARRMQRIREDNVSWWQMGGRLKGIKCPHG